jgi:hypothetical protein
MEDVRTCTQQQAEDLDRAFDAQYLADTRLEAGDAELESWRLVRRAAVDRVFRAHSRERVHRKRIDDA